MNIFEILNNLNISYELIEHEAAYTVKQAQNIKTKIFGLGCKNLFLTDSKKNYFLVVLEENKQADLKEIRKILNTSRLTFSSKEELKEILNLESGSVTPLGIINDIENKTILLLDKDLIGKKILVHPNVNTKTISIDFKDLIKLIEYTNHNYILYNQR